MQGFRFKLETSDTYCINAENSYQASYVFTQQMKHLKLTGRIHFLGYGRKHNTDKYIVADYFLENPRSYQKDLPKPA